jgi:hypothetical protein
MVTLIANTSCAAGKIRLTGAESEISVDYHDVDVATRTNKIPELLKVAQAKN